jgi:glycine/D-amino acid oxidase-like deaminating enzyme
MTGRRAIVVGAGIFGVTAAMELRRRGGDVTLVDPGPLPHPLAASTDISKVVRLDYGDDEDDTAAMERALDGWRRWNDSWPEPLFHETGVLFLRRSLMTEDSFEGRSFTLLSRRGHRLERLDAGAIARRFSAWAPGVFVDGYSNPAGGWAESGRVVLRLVEEARAAGVKLIDGARFERFVERGRRVAGIVVRDASRPRQETRLEADEVILCGGAWTPHVLPELRGSLRSNGLPVFHLRPVTPDLFEAGRFPVFCADITETGWYGFPVNRDGLVKIANHGPGREMHPESADRAVTEAETAELRAFLAGAIPALASAPIVHTRICLYCDTWDGRFWIARHPDRDGLTIAAGDSGHAFKFAPLVGGWIADAVEGRTGATSDRERASPRGPRSTSGGAGAPDGALDRFRWRPEVRPPRSDEAARRQ